MLSLPGASLGSFAGVAGGLLQAVFCPTALPFAMLTAQAVLKGSLSQNGYGACVCTCLVLLFFFFFFFFFCWSFFFLFWSFCCVRGPPANTTLSNPPRPPCEDPLGRPRWICEWIFVWGGAVACQWDFSRTPRPEIRHGPPVKIARSHAQNAQPRNPPGIRRPTGESVGGPRKSADPPPSESATPVTPPQAATPSPWCAAPLWWPVHRGPPQVVRTHTP